MNVKILGELQYTDSVIDIDYIAFEGDYNLKHLSIPKHLEGKSFLYDIDECDDCEIEVRS